ncbi:helix-turn-helix domain-containing protein [Amycolatopsis sp. CA-230715]|uniref:helix-turn-helix domain-containing protein n=1 Tax=Amycolatopsis sp. CA-230715 TaxID=2745196 RepID=UPI001C02F751|nr:helix-turn-helix domain-containing protein [Amycolatopsis sp. CA-230715]
MATVALAVTDGMPLFELGIPCTIFGQGNPHAVNAGYELTICASEGARVGGWLRAEASHGLDALVDADTVVVPACDAAMDAPPADLVDAVRAAHDRGARVASICTGAFVLAAAGLLDGRRATTHWMYADRLARHYPRVDVDPGVLYIDDGDVLTAAGQAAGIDLCLHMVRADHGAAVANGLARRLVVSPHRSGGQAQFIAAPLAEAEERGADDRHDLSGLLDATLTRLGEPLTVADLAREANMSLRNFGRRFTAVTGTSPLRWLLTQRIRRAQELLETGDDSVEQIAVQVGMGTATTLRRHFNRMVGISPTAYRRAFTEDRAHPARAEA